MGAEVIRIDRREAADLGLPGREPKFDVLHRGRRSIALDVKAEAGRAVVKQLVAKADAIIEGFRPGVMERLGLGPEELLAAEPQARVRPHDRLRPGRAAGAGRRPRHQLHRARRRAARHRPQGRGRRCRPSTWSATSAAAACSWPSACCAALLEAQKSGKGQVVDAAMVDGAAYLLAAIYGLYSQGSWADERGVNFVDSGRALVRRLQDQGRQVAVGRRHREALLRGAGREAGPEPRPACPSSTTARAGRSCASVSPRRSPPRRATNGSASSRAATPALPPCWPWARWRAIPTTSRAAPSCAATACCSRAPRPRFSRTIAEMGPPGRPARRRQRSDPEGLGLRRQDRRVEEGGVWERHRR